jgi:hypothetical protein
VDVTGLRRPYLAIALAAGLALAVGCSSSSGSSSGTTTEPHGNAVVTSFDVPDTIDCSAKNVTYVRVPMSYATTGAVSVAVIVDGRDVVEQMPVTGTIVGAGTEVTALPPASGNISAPIHCDAVAHTVVITAKDAQGAPTSQQHIVQVKT